MWRSARRSNTAIWLAVAFWTGGAWITYFVDAPTLVREFWTGTASQEAYFFIGLFTFTTYLLAGWAREQVCTYMCPWPRFQSSMLDEQSLIVTYQGWRGEPRGHGKRAEAHAKLGDCIDCSACVNACPTGVDIRDGVQLECINCGLCIDACNEMMAKARLPRWLVTWDTLARQKAKAEGVRGRLQLIRPRTLVYAGVMVAAMSAMGVALASRALVHLSVQHDRAPLFVAMRDGGIRNAYTIKVSNKTLQDATFTLDMAELPGATMTIADAAEARAEQLRLPVPADDVGTFRVLVFARPGQTRRRLAATRVHAAQRADWGDRDLPVGVHGARRALMSRSTRHHPSRSADLPRRPEQNMLCSVCRMVRTRSEAIR